ncbi:MAG: Transcription initiation factor IIE alpha subunit [Candidatus Methanohalarchaeum thermophilum]|uniref:Transcription factor E n=1 Tax=Methanohalarchaeum thermophilum TaxID=1903181 RepID=A0A1Q6DT92_METT1|nr:MAG: Transcription initiation factor IIE alpha subunit [Candidatus Methanohalarchaeum thermophilum]
MSETDTDKLQDSVVRKFIKEISGEEAIEVVKKLREKETATDEEIAEEVEFDLNNVRKILYKLYENGLAEYTRSRNQDTGWITYTWRLTLENADKVLQNRKEELLKNLKDKLEFETNNVFYACPEGHGKLPFKEASENNFKCPKCDSGLIHYENEETIEKLKERIEELKEKIEKQSH